MAILHPMYQKIDEVLVEQKKEHVHTFDWIIEGSESELGVDA